MRRNLSHILLGGTALLGLLGTPAFAQSTTNNNIQVAQNTPPPKPQARDANTVEEVIVTAEKRSENSQRVPVALTALDGNTLNQQGILGFADLAQRVPDLRFGNGVTGGENVITMRGVGSQNTPPGGDSPVAYSVDGVTLQRTTVIDPEFYDIGVIDVARGPQGTLDGRNSVGGSIHVNTNHPTDDLEGAVDAEIGNYASQIFRGYINAPLYDNGGTEINVRITGVDSYHSGYVTNVDTGPYATHNLDGEDLHMLRGQVDIKFSPDVDLLLEASTLNNNDPVATKVQFQNAPYRYPGQTFYGSPWVVDNNYPDTAIDKVNYYIATLNWNLGWAVLTDVAGYETSYHDSSNDADGSGLAIATNSDWLEKQQQISNEIRLRSNNDADPLRWVGGFYFFQAQNFENFDFLDNGLNSPPVGPAPDCAYPLCDAYSFYSHGNLSSRSFAPFGQIDYDLAKTSLEIPLTITAGLRYTDDEKYGSGALRYDGFPIIAPPSTHDWGQWTGKFELAYQFTPDVMGYASISRGYLSGGNIIGLASFYEPEHVWSYEVGEKANLFDDHLQLNLTGFHESLVNMQVFIQSGPNSSLENAAMAHVNGFEGEATWIPIDGLRLNTAVTITDAKYNKYITNDNRYAAASTSPKCDPAPPYECNFAGNDLNQTPPYTVELGAEYNWDTPIGTFTPRVDAFWSGQVVFLPDNINNQKPYEQTDLNLMWTDPSGRYTLDAFVKNLSNTAVITNDGLQSTSLSGPLGVEPDNYVYAPPRTFGVRLGVKFGG
jgi:iron complex outermembrane receptor protein